MTKPDTSRSPSSDDTPLVTRRQVLGGMAGIAGLVAAPSLLAACGAGASPSPAAGSPAPATGGASPPASLGGQITLGSNLSDEVPKKALQDIVDAFTGGSGVTVKINTVDHTTFQNQLTSYLQGTPDDVFTWFSGYRMRFFAGQGLATEIDDVWAKVGSKFTDAFKVASTSDDGHQYLVPFVTYAWCVFYRKSLFQEKSYAIPTTLDEFKALSAQMQKDGLIPIGFGDKDGWPAMGHFDILNLRTNGYQFHVDLMAGKEKWTDSRVKDVFNAWKDLLPFYQEGSAGRSWQDAAAGLLQKKSGMMLQPQVGETFAASGQADFDDLDFFPWPNHGTQWDAEKALDAPIDGFMISKNSPTLAQDLDGAKAFVEFIGQGSSQLTYVKANPSLIGTANDVDTSAYTPLQKRQAEVIGAAQKLTQFLDRDTRPDFAGPNAMQAFLIDFLQKPTQDLDAFLANIQGFWDTLT